MWIRFSSTRAFHRFPVLIETLWNVNSVGSGTSKVTGIVLIETLWNVNLEEGVLLDFAPYVLIETLWNVNLPANNL